MTVSTVATGSRQGELLTGLQPDPHFEEIRGSELVAYGVAVDLLERNEALQDALLGLGRIARGASFREIGNQQRAGSRSKAVQRVEARYSQYDLEEKMTDSLQASERLSAAVTTDFDRAFGTTQLAEHKDELDVHKRDGAVIPLTLDGIHKALRSGKGVVDENGRRAQPGHMEGRAEFEARFAGSNNRGPRDRYKSRLKSQAAYLRRMKR